MAWFDESPVSFEEAGDSSVRGRRAGNKKPGRSRVFRTSAEISA
ncbi:hypothetical protein HMPREF0321_1767 [Dermacoccus sp. Ellin185]|nr:hypothetical protein HMPREF0321_1767 [Dermacoccus sp. Ellin185]